MNKLTFLVLVVTAVAHASTPSVFKYLIEGLPNTGATCAEEAERLAAEFKTQSKIALANGRCKKDHGAEYDIQIDYSADFRVQPVSTIDYVVGVAASWQGSYARRDLCEAELPMQTDMFTRETKLEPLVAYCYQESKEPRNSFALRIDAFGDPKIKPMVVNLELFGYLREDIEAAENHLRTYARAKIPALSTAVIRDFSYTHSVRVVYYAEKRLPVRRERMGEYRGAESCLRAKSLAQPKITAALKDAPPLLCVNDTLLQRHSLELFQVKTGEHLDLVPYPKTYGTYAECEADTGEAMAEVAKTVKGSPVAAACHDTSGGAALTVLVRAR